MIENKKLKRILRHLSYYGNTIIVESDFKFDTLDGLIRKIESEGWIITEICDGRKVNPCQNHYVIRAKRRANGKWDWKIKSIKT